MAVKDRINISVSRSTRNALAHLAKRDRVPLAAKAAGLIHEALELEEDRALSEIAKKRDKKGVRWVKDGDALWR